MCVINSSRTEFYETEISYFVCKHDNLDIISTIKRNSQTGTLSIEMYEKWAHFFLLSVLNIQNVQKVAVYLNQKSIT